MKETITQVSTSCQCKSSPQQATQPTIPKIGDSGWFPLIDKHPVVAFVIVREGKEIAARPCNFRGESIELRSREEIIGIVPAAPGFESVEYTSAVEIDETVFVRLGCQQPNETTDWKAQAIAKEEFRLSQVGAGRPGSPRILSRDEFQGAIQ
jgi:hypothetical protein